MGTGLTNGKMDSAEVVRVVTGRNDRKITLLEYRRWKRSLGLKSGHGMLGESYDGWKALPKDRNKCLLCFSAVEDVRHVIMDYTHMSVLKANFTETVPQMTRSQEDRDRFVRIALFGRFNLILTVPTHVN